MQESDLAAPLITFGAVLCLFSVWVYPPLQRHLGTQLLTRLGLLLAALVCMLLPSVAAARTMPALSQVSVRTRHRIFSHTYALWYTVCIHS